jgi:glycosyltransferase involved in cell wall biosynthesis
MNIVFFTSILNHHQLPFCKEMFNALGNNFTLVTTMEIEEQRKVLGYKDLADEYPFCFKMYSSTENYNRAFRLSQECDVLISGVIPEEFIDERMKLKKLTFRYSERFFKNGNWRVLSPNALKIAFKRHFRYRKHPLYLLCASAYLPNDASLIFSYPNKMLKWGYFPEFYKYDFKNLLKKQDNGVIKILWVGRFLNWKQPQHALLAAQHLNKLGVKFQLEMIGTGPILNKMVQLSKEIGLTNKVNFLGPLSPIKVRDKMVDSDVFLFTSNREEGWGVVLNEAMNSGCAVIANNDIGAVPYLIKDNENGLIYNEKDMSSFYKLVEKICLNDKIRTRLSKEAYNTIEKEWNAVNAVKRLLQQIDTLLSGKKLEFYKNGPLSLAEKK